MIEVFGCFLLTIIGSSFVLMVVDELKTNYELRKSLKESDKDEVE